MKLTKSQLKQIIEEELQEARLPAWERPGYVPAPGLGPEDPRKYGDDIDPPSLQAQMKTAILAAVEALDAGDVEAARAAFPEDLLKELRPYAGPVGKIPTSAQLATQAGYDI